MNDKKIEFRLSPLMIRVVRISHRQMGRERLKDRDEELEGATGPIAVGDDK